MAIDERQCCRLESITDILAFASGQQQPMGYGGQQQYGQQGQPIYVQQQRGMGGAAAGGAGCLGESLIPKCTRLSMSAGVPTYTQRGWDVEVNNLLMCPLAALCGALLCFDLGACLF